MSAEDRSFQCRVANWMMATFSMEVCRDTTERNHRFLEEALELVQAFGCTAAEAHMLVEYVYGRPVGEQEQEIGGVMVTLAALCEAADLDMAACGETELARVWNNIERIRAKQATKPRNSPLPSAPERPSAAQQQNERTSAAADLRGAAPKYVYYDTQGSHHLSVLRELLRGGTVETGTWDAALRWAVSRLETSPDSAPHCPTCGCGRGPA